jgi:putative CocE/NonD family hydrolase
MLGPIIESQIPSLHIGGWFDGFLRGTTKLYGSMASSGTARLLVGPRFHIPLTTTGAYAEYFGYEGSLGIETWAEQIRFFDWCVRGIENGYQEEPPVKIYVMNSGWRAEASWPLARRDVRSFYLREGGELSTEAGEAGADPYKIDFSHSSNYGSNQSNRWLLMEAPDTLMLRTRLDRKALVYETAPLESDVEVTGHPLAHLWLGSDQSEADVFVYLSDVDKAGDVHYVTEGQLRAGFSGLHDPALQTGHAVEVRPELPWHGYREGDFSGGAFAGDRIVDLQFDLMPTAWTFRAGHRIRISIVGADYGNFELNPGLCSGETPETCVETVLIVHRGPATPSRIELPIIPGS